MEHLGSIFTMYEHSTYTYKYGCEMSGAVPENDAFFGCMFFHEYKIISCLQHT